MNNEEGQIVAKVIGLMFHEGKFLKFADEKNGCESCVFHNTKRHPGYRACLAPGYEILPTCKRKIFVEHKP